MKTILVVNNSSQISGAEFSLLELLDTLKNHYKIIIAIPEKGDFGQKLSSLNYQVEYFRMLRFSRKSNGSNKLRYAVTLLATSFKILCYAKKNNIDLLYLNSNQSAVYSIFIRVLTPIKTIWHVRDSLKNKMITKVLSLGVSQVICVSKYIYAQIPVKKEKKTLIYNGIDTDLWKPFRKTNGLLPATIEDEKTILIGNIGQLIPWKNHMELIKVVKLISSKSENVHFLFLGDDLFNQYPEYVNQLKLAVGDTNLTGYISFLGNRQNILSYINQIDILVHCATEEPFGRVVMEAMALQKPVVAYKSGGVAELIVENKTGFLVEPYNYSDFADKLELLLKNKPLRDKFGFEGRKRIQANFSAEIYTGKIQTLIKKQIA
ncbi:glycosyltransferase [Mucilaginibacter sp. SJ]|uniref:glycosyltransferase n=1 Tax=Mucilaginibacter sp. SJ TaxID=3029053 RepID=UPI0023A9E4E6|nr:glycosyltransferase [Mucilaginibacter sp. SJ]WEA01630.1 glycosyltransferase [Mucilaginibacter sp. SJ]